MTSTSAVPSTALAVSFDAAEHATAEAVAWAGTRAVVVGSAGTTDATPAETNPIMVDGARYHGWIRSLDVQGAALWTRRLEKVREVHIRAVASTSDEIVVAGEQRLGEEREYTAWIARIGSDGTEHWRREGLGMPGATGLQAIALRSDGNVVAGGLQRGVGWLTMFDASGGPRWAVDIATLDEITAVTALGDGIVVAGVTGRSTVKAGRSRLIGVDASGAIQWTTELPVEGTGELFALAMLGDGGVAVGQASDRDGREGAWVVRFAAGGAIRSSHVIAGIGTASARGGSDQRRRLCRCGQLVRCRGWSTRHRVALRRFRPYAVESDLR